MLWRPGPWIAALVLLTACEFTEFEIDMEIDGVELVRRMVTRQVDVDHGERVLRACPAEHLARIAAAYGTEVPDPVPSELRFEGRFKGKTPNDVGGSGYVAVHEAPMGRLVAWSEQFRGEADPGVVMERAFQAADQWMDLVVGWLRAELGERKGWDRLQTLLDGQLRRDLKNLVGTFYLTVGPDSRLNTEARMGLNGEEEFLLRVLHLFVTKGYLTDEDIPPLFRAMNHSGDRALAAALPVLRRAITRATDLSGRGDALEHLLALLVSEDMEASLLRHIEASELWKEKLAAWEAAAATEPDRSRPEPSGITDDLLSAMVGASLVFGSEDHLTVRLRCPTQPHRTNGRWDAAAGKLEWIGTPAHGGQLPSMAFAFWTEPDTGFQEAHFGRVVLSGEALEEYVLWYRGLHTGERRQWDALLKSLRPNSDAIKRLQSFTFRATDGKAGGTGREGAEPQKDPGRGLLLEALEKQGEGIRP